MNKKIFLVLSIALCNSFVFAQKPATVTGHFTGIAAGTPIVFEKLNYSFIKPIDTFKVAADGGFIFKDTIKEDGLYRIRLTDALNVLVVLQPTTQLVKIETDTVRMKTFDYTVEGSPLTTQIRDFVIQANQKYAVVQQLGADLQNPMLPDSIKQVKQMQLNFYNSQATLFIQSYLDTVTSPVIGAFGGLSFIDVKSDVKFATKLEKRLYDTYKDNSLVHDFVAHAEEIKKQMEPPVAFPVGTVVPDIVLKDTSGKEIRLYDIKDKYVLIDFWASWCGPCRAENPNVANMYQKYKDKGFTVFSISLDNDKKKWETAIAKDKLAWPYHVSELKGWQSQICQPWKIQSIPSNFLIDKDRKVIENNLRAEDLQNVLQQLLDKQ